MSIQKKYYYTFKSISNQQYTVEIWQNTTDIITAVEILGDVKPFTVQYPSITKFDTVRGSGCEINLISKTDRQFFSLFTANFLEYQIRLYKDAALIWCGYLDSELYTEDFSNIDNYSVSFSGTDGFALLERLNYVDASKNHYTGITSQFAIVQNIINKLNLPYNNIYFNLSTTSSELTIAEAETILHKTFVINSNYYNEDNEPETCRTVLMNQLAVYGAFIIQSNGNLFITDDNVLATGGTVNFKKYDSAFNYIGLEAINLNIGDLSTIKFADSTQTFNVVPAFNKQIIKYSPYTEKVIIDFNADEDFTTVASTINYKPATSFNAFWWDETLYTNSNTWTKTNNGKFVKMAGVTAGNSGTVDNYLKIDKYGIGAGYLLDSTTLSYKCKLNLPYVIPSNYKIKVNAKAFVRTIDTLGNDADKTADMFFLEFFCRVKIDNKKYCYKPTQLGANDFIRNQTIGWKDLTSTDYYSMVFSKGAIGSVATNISIDNEWIDLKWYSMLSDYSPVANDFMIPLTGFAGGLLEFEIYGFRVWPKWSDSANTTKSDALMAKVKDVRLKDIAFTLVDENNKEIDSNDLEYVGYMNADYKDSGSDITLYNGTSIKKNPVERGSLLGYNGTNYFFLQSWTREGKTDIIENLLLRSIVSNYTDKTIELSCVSNMINSMVGTLTYSNYLAGLKLMPVSCNLNYSDELAELTIQQINKDSLEINKSF